MGKRIDVGAYFEQLTRRARGGRRSVAAGKAPPASATPASPRQDRRPGRGLPPEGTVVVEYTPNMDDGDPDPGEVVWIWVPYEEDPTQGKDRPLVVIGRRSHALVGVPLTTKANAREAQIEVGVGDWDPKRRVSYARIWRMLDIDPASMRREGAVIDRDRFDLIVKAVDEYYDVQSPRR
jgi:hypothetical protein